MKTIGYIAGIPFNVDNEADEKAFAPMFPKGGEFNNVDTVSQISATNFRSPFLENSNIPAGINVISNEKLSVFAYNGLDSNNLTTYVYTVDAIPIDDGAKVYNTTKEDKIDGYDMRLYFESEAETKNNLFGSFYVAKMGKQFANLVDKLLNTEAFSINATIDSIIYTEQITDFSSLVSYMIKLAQERQHVKLDENKAYDAIMNAYIDQMNNGSIINLFSSIDEIAATGLNWCADKLNGFMLKEKKYDATLNEYDPIIGLPSLVPGAIKPTLFKDIADNEFFKEAESLITSAYNYAVNALKKTGRVLMGVLPDPVKKIIGKVHQVVQQIKTGIENLVDEVAGFLKAITALVDEVLKMVNAFLCGIINGIIGTVQTLLYILAFLLDMAGSDKDYQSYLRRRDFGEKIESIIDFMVDGFSALIGAIKNIFTNGVNIDTNDIKELFASVGGLFEYLGDKAEDFWKHNSRYKFAYWAGIGVFEIVIGVLLALFTGGFGNIAKAATTAEKIGAFAKIVGRETLSTVTFGVLDILSFFKSIITAFANACKKGLKGLLRWIVSLISEVKNGKKGSNVDELLNNVEDNINDIDFPYNAKSGGVYGGKILSEKEIENWANLLFKKFGTKLEKVEKFANPHVLAQFDSNTNTIRYKEEVTEYIMAHEFYHAEEMNKIGFDKYVKDAPLRNVAEEDYTKENWLRLYKREKYVYEMIQKNQKLHGLNQQEIWHSWAYFTGIEYDLKQVKIKIPK